MSKKKQLSRKGCRGRRLEIQVAKSDTLLQDDKSTIAQGEVIDAGPEAYCKVGDIVIFNHWGLDPIKLNDVEYHYILDTDEFICKVL